MASLGTQFSSVSQSPGSHTGRRDECRKRLRERENEPMPLCTIKMFEGELTQAQAADLIRQVTEAIIPFVGEKLRDNTWVLQRILGIAMDARWASRCHRTSAGCRVRSCST